MKNGAALLLLVLGGAVLLGLLHRDYDIRYDPHGPGRGILNKTHPLKRDKFLRVEWKKDQAHREYGWCVWAKGENERAARWHLVLHGDGETMMPTHPSWWNN